MGINKNANLLEILQYITRYFFNKSKFGFVCKNYVNAYENEREHVLERWTKWEFVPIHQKLKSGHNMVSTLICSF